MQIFQGHHNRVTVRIRYCCAIIKIRIAPSFDPRCSRNVLCCVIASLLASNGIRGGSRSCRHIRGTSGTSSIGRIGRSGGIYGAWQTEFIAVKHYAGHQVKHEHQYNHHIKSTPQMVVMVIHRPLAMVVMMVMVTVLLNPRTVIPRTLRLHYMLCIDLLNRGKY